MAREIEVKRLLIEGCDNLQRIFVTQVSFGEELIPDSLRSVLQFLSIQTPIMAGRAFY
jgi:hypothetical protein